MERSGKLRQSNEAQVLSTEVFTRLRAGNSIVLILLKRNPSLRAAIPAVACLCVRNWWTRQRIVVSFFRIPVLTFHEQNDVQNHDCVVLHTGDEFRLVDGLSRRSAVCL